MDFPSLLDAVMQLERQVTSMRPGDPRLADVRARIDTMEHEVEQARGMAQPLVPDGGVNYGDETADNLERALRSLRSAVESKR